MILVVHSLINLRFILAIIVVGSITSSGLWIIKPNLEVKFAYDTWINCFENIALSC